MEGNEKKEPEIMRETIEAGSPETVENGSPEAVCETAGDRSSETAESGSSEAAQKEERQPGGSMFEGIYDKLPDISVRAVDRFIILCIIAFIAVILVGILKANHVF